MSAHTPGPWIIEAENPNDIISDVYDVEICNIQPVDTGGPKNWHHGEQTKANATLIACAPELLAAAKRYLEFRHLADCGMGYRFSGVHPKTELENAIARAEGVQQAADPKPKQCIRCSGYGTVSTGIDESPSTICNACEGTGEVRV